MFPIIDPMRTFGEGMGMVPNLLSDLNTLQKQRMANQTQQALMPFAVPEAQAQLAFEQARAPFLQARANRYDTLAQAGGNKIIQTPNGYYSYNPLTGQTQPVNAPGGNQLMPRNTGLQVVSTPGGGFTISTGGMQITPPGGSPLPEAQSALNKLQGLTGIQNPQQLAVNPQQVSQLQQAPAAAAGNIVQMPSSPHSRFSNAGATLVDTATGNAVSVPTSGQVGRWQKAIGAGDVLAPQLRNIYKQIEPFVGPSNFMNRAKGMMDRYTNTPNADFDAYTSATQKMLPQTGDLMLNEMGLNATTGNRVELQKAITPQGMSLSGAPDTPASYAKGIADTLAGIAMRDNTYQKFLKGGLSLSPQNDADRAAFSQAISDKIYWELRKQNAPRKTIGGNTYYKIDGQWHQEQ